MSSNITLINPIDQLIRSQSIAAKKQQETCAYICTTKVFGAGSIDWPELHTTNWIRGQTDCPPTERRLHWLPNGSRRSKVNNKSSECWASIFDPPLHKPNKRRTKSSNKLRGNHDSRWTPALPCSTCRPKQSESTEDSSVPTALNAMRRRVEHYHCRFDISNPYLIISSPIVRRTRIKKAVANSTVDRIRSVSSNRSTLHR